MLRVATQGSPPAEHQVHENKDKNAEIPRSLSTARTSTYLGTTRASNRTEVPHFLPSYSVAQLRIPWSRRRRRSARMLRAIDDRFAAHIAIWVQIELCGGSPGSWCPSTACARTAWRSLEQRRRRAAAAAAASLPCSTSAPGSQSRATDAKPNVLIQSAVVNSCSRLLS